MATILDESKAWIPAEQLSNMRDLVRAGEPGVALENLCVQLFGYDAVIPLALRERLRSLAEQMGIAVEYWQRLSVSETQVSDPSVCRVCGLHVTPPPWGDDGRTPLFEYCPCCAIEWGYPDATPEGARKFRAQWLQRGGEWNQPDERPPNWDRAKQLAAILTDYQ